MTSLESIDFQLAYWQEYQLSRRLFNI